MMNNSRSSWNEYKIGLLKKYYGVIDNSALCERIGMTQGTLREKALELGLGKSAVKKEKSNV